MSYLTYKIYTLGCKVNQYDSGRLAAGLEAVGLRPANKNSQLAIINTCAVTQTAVHKSRRMVNRARAENPEAKIAVIGCWPQAYGGEAEKIGADLSWGVGNLNALREKIIDLIGSRTVYFPANFSECGNLRLPSYSFINRSKVRYFLKIQDGCGQFCSYCIIPYTRGRPKSRSFQKVIGEAELAVKAGYREVVLCGIHLGLYGRDSGKRPAGNEKKSILTALLRRLIQIKNLGRIRLSSIEITEVDDELIELMAGSRKICRHLHIPLQSGSDKILKLMNRPYDVEYFSGQVKKIRRLMPDIALTTDVIVGFPGETKENFTETNNFVRTIDFSRLHIFPFSVHKGTLAAVMPDRVEKGEIKKRSRELKELAVKLSRKYRRRFAGRELAVVVERAIAGRGYSGKTEFYFDIEFNKAQISRNFSRLSVNDADDMIGEIVRVSYN